MTNIKKVILIINEQHTLLPDQERRLGEEFPWASVEKVGIPADGLSLADQLKLANKLVRENTHPPKESDTAIVFVSPVPALLANVSRACAVTLSPSVYIFANDRREKKEINGRVISVVAKEGWQLVSTWESDQVGYD